VTVILRPLIDVRQAVVLVGRHPETIRRWIWSGRLAGQRRGRRLFVVTREVRAVAGQDTMSSMSPRLGAFMSRRNTLVCPGGKMDLAMQLIFSP